MGTGGRTIPSGAGGGIARAGEAIARAIELKRSRALISRRLDIDEQVAAVTQYTTLSDLLPIGTTLGDLGPSGMELFEKAFGVPGEGLESLEMNEQTTETLLNSLSVDFLESDEGKNLILPSIRSRLRLEPNAAVDELRTQEAELRSGALTNILNDPGLMGDFQANLAGQDPVRLRIPGVPGEISFDSPTAANIYAQFLLARERFSFELNLDDAEALSGLIDEIQKAVSESGQSISSPAIQGRIFPLYQRAVQSGETAEVVAFLNSETVSQGEKLALEFMLGSIGKGENVVLNNLPPQMRNFLVIGQTIRDILGPEAAAEILPSITEALDPQQFGIFRNRFFRGLDFEIPGPVSPDQPIDALGGLRTGGPVEGQPSAINVPRPIRLTTANQILVDQSMSREDLVATVGEDVVAEAEEALLVQSTPTDGALPPGGINPETVPRALQADAARLNRLLVTLEGTSGAIARKNLQNVIDRLRVSIEKGIR